MIRLEISPLYPSERRLQQAIAILREGGLVIYPTDTIYGLGCDLLSKRGVERIYRLKGNDKRKLLSFIRGRNEPENPPGIETSLWR